ncbi:hypothetical protein ACLOJK_026865 [Asimina triloba]
MSVVTHDWPNTTPSKQDRAQLILKAASLQELSFFDCCAAPIGVLVGIWDCYGVPSNIVLSAPELHETPQDYLPWHIFLYESMLKTGVWTPFEFKCALLLIPKRSSRKCLSFTNGRAIAHTGYVEFTGRDDVKTINNSPDPTPGWKTRFFFARLTSKRVVWGIHNRLVEPLPELVSEPVAGLVASQRLTLMYFQGSVLRWFLLKEEFLYWCGTLVHLVAAASVPSLLEAERKKEHFCKRARSSAE